uniref:Uncharacterized protein n=1 Tax=Arundo donax TaxID=35708 RepID=A0A0A9FGY2_ARUDO
MEAARLGASCRPPRARSSFPALGWMPGHTVSPHRLYSASVAPDAPCARSSATTAVASASATALAIAGLLATCLLARTQADKAVGLGVSEQRLQCCALRV